MFKLEQQLEEIADPSRRSILNHLRSGPKSVSELVALTSLKQPNVSNHLSRLKDTGMVVPNRDGQRIIYRISDPSLETLLSNVTSGPSPAVCEDIASSKAALAAEYFNAIVHGNSEAAMASVTESMRIGMSLEDIYTEIFQDSMCKVGEMYEAEKISVADEHVASAITERMMSMVSSRYAPANIHGKLALLGSVAGNNHFLGIRMVADFLHLQGWRCLFMGANVPSSSFVDMIRTKKPALSLVSAATPQHFPELTVLLNAITEIPQQFGIPKTIVGVGGAILQSYSESEIPNCDFTASSLSELQTELKKRF